MKQRAVAEQLRVQNLGRNRVFSDYQVTNPKTGGQYRVSIRGFDVGDVPGNLGCGSAVLASSTTVAPCLAVPSAIASPMPRRECGQ